MECFLRAYCTFYATMGWCFDSRLHGSGRKRSLTTFLRIGSLRRITFCLVRELIPPAGKFACPHQTEKFFSRLRINGKSGHRVKLPLKNHLPFSLDRGTIPGFSYLPAATILSLRSSIYLLEALEV